MQLVTWTKFDISLIIHDMLSGRLNLSINRNSLFERRLFAFP